MGLLTADRWRSTGVNSKFEVKNRELDAGTVETIPMGFNDVDNGGAGGKINIKTDDKVLVKFRLVARALPLVNVGANVDEGFRRVADGAAELLKLENTLIDVVTVVHRNVTVNGLGTPNLGWDFDDKDLSRWG